MICVGIESTAHTFGVGVVKGQKVLANEFDSYLSKEGIIPVEAAKHHRAVCRAVFSAAMDRAKIGLADVDLIAFSAGPGLPPCLLVGMNFARSLKKPIVGVNHCVAHIEIGKKMTAAADPLAVYVSGGNTQITALVEKRYRVFGETLDIGIGNAFDKFARNIGLRNGADIEKLARQGKKYIELPYTVKGMDLAFSGLVTAASKKKDEKVDLAFSFQETAFSMLTEVTERALAHAEKKEVLLVGGVAANKRLQKMMKIMCAGRGAKFHVPKKEYCGDNGAMIAMLGALAKKGMGEIKPRWRTDEVEVIW